MPTAPKLVSAVAFALVGLFAGLACIAQQPLRTAACMTPAIVAALGFIIGWRFFGRNFGKRYGQSVGYGLPSSILFVWALSGFSTFTEPIKATRQLYRAGVVRAVRDITKIIMEYGKPVIAQEVFIAPVVGGIMGGMVVEFSARRWT